MASQLILPPNVQRNLSKPRGSEWADFAKQVGVVYKSFLTGNAALGMGLGSNAGMGSATGSNLGGLSNQLIARVTNNLASTYNRTPEEVELALAEQGLSWGAPFPPGRPLDPFYGYKRDPRTWDYPVGTNTQITPRWGRVSFPTLRAMYDAWDVEQIIDRHMIADIRSLEYSFVPPKGEKGDVTADIAVAEQFFESPDGLLPFETWLAKFLLDKLRYDAAALYVRRNNGGDAIALEVVSGATIMPLIDFYGRVPVDGDERDVADYFEGEVVPAYQQIIEGLPWDWLTFDDLLYTPWNPDPESQYGRSPLEMVLLAGNTDLRFQMHFLEYFTAGSLPAGFMSAPADLSNPAMIQEYQETWDALMLGEQEKLRQIRWVPYDSKFEPVKNADFNDEFPLYLMRKNCAAHGVTPTDMGFTESVNKSSSDTQVDVQFRVGTLPLALHLQAIFNMFIRRELKLKCQFQFELGREEEDRLATAQADAIYIEHGVISADEPRTKLGYPVDNSRPTPRYINNPRQGPIALISLESASGKVDPETYAPAKDQPLISTPPAPMAGVLPPQGSPEAIAAAAQTAQMGRDLVAATTGKSPAEGSPAPDQTTTPKTQAQLPDSDKESQGGKVVKPGEVDPDAPKPATTELAGQPNTPSNGSETADTSTPKSANDKASKSFDWRSILAVLDSFEKAGEDNTGGPGVHPLGGSSTTVTGGVIAGTGIHGTDLKDDDEDEDEDDDDETVKGLATALAIRQWRANTRNRLRKGQAPRLFESTDLPTDLAESIWKELESARSREQVDAAFKAGARPKARAGVRSATDFHQHTDRIVEHYGPLIQSAQQDRLSHAAVVNAVKAAQGSSKVAKSAAGDAASAAAIKVLQAALKPADKLKVVLTGLYGDGAIQGARTAGEVSGGTLPFLSKLDVSGNYWDSWQPGYGEAASKLADGGLKDLLDQQDVTIKGLTDSMLERLGNVIADGVGRGDSTDTIASAASDVIADPARADVIANTETARAMVAASLDTYDQNDVAQVDWLAEDDACPECDANASGSPYDLDSAPDCPDHPSCRCAISPVAS